MIDNRVADLRVGDGFDIRENKTDLARGQFVAGHRFRGLKAEPVHFISTVRSTRDGFSGPCVAPIDDTGQNDHAAIGIEPGVEDQRAQWIIRQALGGGTRCTTASSTS